MPELPEVETTLRGIQPHIAGKKVKQVIVRQNKLRWLIPHALSDTLSQQTVQECTRRAKYLLIRFEAGVLIIHLGMSGSLRIFQSAWVPEASKHDHVDFIFDDETVMRYHDPRKFGAILWFNGVAEHHDLLAQLGPEPLHSDFHAGYLMEKLKKQSRAIKTALMDNTIVVGVGNIYANESLFHAGILPERPARSLSLDECKALVQAIQQVLQRAIETGGSTLKDFVNSDGKSGYFQQEYKVYGRNGQSCDDCGNEIEKKIIGQRGTFYCRHCQK